MFVQQRRDRRELPVPFMVVIRKGKHYLPSFSTEEALWEKIVQWIMECKYWKFVVRGEAMRLNIALKLCTQIFMRNLLKQSLSDISSNRKRATWDALAGTVKHDAPQSGSQYLSGQALEQKMNRLTKLKSDLCSK